MVGHLQVRTQSLVNTVYLNYFQIPVLYFATTVLHLRKKHRNKINSETGLKIMTPRDIQYVSKLFLNCIILKQVHPNETL